MSGLLVAAIGPEMVLATFLLFCRIGACMLVIPGFSSDRVAMRIRLLMAVASTFAMAPMLLPIMRQAMPDLGPATTVRLIAGELYIGLLIGLMGRAFIAALEMIGTLMSMAIGMNNIPGVPVGGGETMPPLASLLSVTATAMIFITDQHQEVFRGLAQSYMRLPPSLAIQPLEGLEQFADQLSVAFFLALRIGSPFIVYSVAVNFAIGITNRLTPQIPVYFISMPLIIIGGLYFLFVVISDFMRIFLDGYFSWLQYG
ncbi:flagellar biosynthetic protein FliR [Breoghania corrubedonensis]|uniref:Flagellar biosynthetic protein FliR n=1 Tax=Breoghania corrubedonensis TaxID=665038 RepID=A0A2T5V8V5_9HYPH|nr:flagellar biosynthetic protein FliR [Breoghania corrubedonensis]PTW60170.1 flagellar biosynthetic protein FliR [Breoghania corrubedonensis]